MGRHAGDYLLGTTFLAVSIFLAISHGKSESAIRYPGEAGCVSPTLNTSGSQCATVPHDQSTIAVSPLQPARAVVKNLSRGTRIVVGSLDVSGAHHGLLVTVGSNDPVRIESLPVTHFSVSDIRRSRNEKSLSMRHAVEDGTSCVAFRSAKERCFREAKGDIGNRARNGEMRCSVGTQAAIPVVALCHLSSNDSPDRVFLTPHFVAAGAIHKPAECRFIGESPRVRIFVDQRLVHSMDGRQFTVWSESLTSAAEFRALPIVDEWVGAIRDVDHDQKLSIVVTDLDRRGQTASASSPIHGCIRESDFLSDSDFCGDIIYFDPSIFELATDELAALLTHEATHAAVCSMRPDESIDTVADADKAGSRRSSAESRVPAWLNEAVAHFVELQCSDEAIRAAGVSQNFQRRMDDFFANPAGSPIVAAEDVLSLEERRGGSRGAATLFLARWFSSSKTLRRFVHSRAPFDRRIEDLAQAPFADVFRDWTLSLASLSELPTLSARQEAPFSEHRSLRFDSLPAVGIQARFSLFGTAFRCFECSEDIESVVIESDVAARLQISIIEPKADISTMAGSATRHF